MLQTQSASFAKPSDVVRASRRRRSLMISASVCAVILGFLWYIGVFGGNIHTVAPGKVYRSAELTGRNLDDLMKARQIHTVINLRGGSPSDAWYRSELDVTRRNGADHVDITMSARHLPDPAKLKMLLDTFDHARYPVLYHCMSGADRSGLVGTIYLDVYQHVPLDKAESEQLTWHYGHFSFGETHAMDEFFDLYRQTSHGQDLRTWMVRTYPAIYARSGDSH